MTKPPAMPEPLGWYVVNNIGMATLCADEAEAQSLAKDCDMVYKRQAPHRAVQLVALAALPSAQPAEVSDAEIVAAGHRTAWRYKHSSDPAHSSTYTFNLACLLRFARAILALRPAQQAAPEPVGVAPSKTVRPATTGYLEAYRPDGTKLYTRPAPVETEPAGGPTEGEFFAWDPEGGHAFYKTRQEAIEHAEEILCYYRDGANHHGEWDEDVERIRWGVVMQRAKAANTETEDEGESYCEYELQDVATRPAPGVPEVDMDDLPGHLAEISIAVCDGDNLAAQSGLRDAIRLIAAAQAKGGEA